MAKRRTRSEIQMTGYLVVAVLVVIAWYSSEWLAWALPMMAWVAYELCFCPTACSVQTNRNEKPCSNPVLGRLFACTRVGDHQRKKNAAFLRLLGIGSLAPAPRPSRTEHGSPPLPPSEPAQVETGQKAMLYLTVIATIGTVIQAITALVKG